MRLTGGAALARTLAAAGVTDLFGVPAGKLGPFAKAVAQLLEKQTPKEVVSKMAKVDRRGKVFVDWSQNHQKKTTIGVYSLRARERPTASIPLKWRKVERTAKGADPEKLRFEIPAAIKRVEKEGDLFEPVLKLRQKLPDIAELVD